MDNNDPLYETHRRPRLYFTREQFDDYWIALLAKIRRDETANRIISGELNNPLVRYQQRNSASLRQLRVPFIPTEDIMRDPSGSFEYFFTVLARLLLRPRNQFRISPTCKRCRTRTPHSFAGNAISTQLSLTLYKLAFPCIMLVVSITVLGFTYSTPSGKTTAK